MSIEMLNLNGMTVKANQDFLVLEDDDSINTIITDSLKLIGFTGKIFQAYSIAEAQKVLKTKHVDYILSDWNLPDGQGIALLKAVRSTARLKDTPFLMITGNDDIESMMTSSKIGVSEYLVKPFQVQDLERKLIEGWKYHLVKNEEFIKNLENRISELEKKIDHLETENKELKDKLSIDS